MNPQLQDKQLDALYAELPAFECQGHCADICRTTLMMSARERARMEKAHGPVKARMSGWCSMFDTETRRCKAHALRPMLCRLWGLSTDMRCPYGCEPERYLTPEEEVDFLKRAEEIGGNSKPVAELQDRFWYQL